MSFSAEEKRKEVEREVAMRKRVYHRYSSMNPQEAKYKIEIMEAIAADYAALEEQERLL